MFVLDFFQTVIIVAVIWTKNKKKNKTNWIEVAEFVYIILVQQRPIPKTTVQFRFRIYYNSVGRCWQSSIYLRPSAACLESFTVDITINRKLVYTEPEVVASAAFVFLEQWYGNAKSSRQLWKSERDTPLITVFSKRRRYVNAHVSSGDRIWVKT